MADNLFAWSYFERFWYLGIFSDDSQKAKNVAMGQMTQNLCLSHEVCLFNYRGSLIKCFEADVHGRRGTGVPNTLENWNKWPTREDMQKSRNPKYTYKTLLLLFCLHGLHTSMYSYVGLRKVNSSGHIWNQKYAGMSKSPVQRRQDRFCTIPLQS